MQRPQGQLEMLITFLYYRDLAQAMRFYKEILGLELAIDQGWSKIYRVNQGGYVGLVDEARGYHQAAPTKPVMLCLRVPDANAWYRYLQEQGVTTLGPPKDNAELRIRAFLFHDPEGYVLEIQEALA